MQRNVVSWYPSQAYGKLAHKDMPHRWQVRTSLHQEHLEDRTGLHACGQRAGVACRASSRLLGARSRLRGCDEGSLYCAPLHCVASLAASGVVRRSIWRAFQRRGAAPAALPDNLLARTLATRP